MKSSMPNQLLDDLIKTNIIPSVEQGSCAFQVTLFIEPCLRLRRQSWLNVSPSHLRITYYVLAPDSHHRQQRLRHLRRCRRYADSSGFEGLDLGSRRSFASAHDGASMAHSAARWRGRTGKETGH